MSTLERELTEAEKQVLIAVSALESQEKGTDKSSVEALGRDYFGMYLADWTGAYDSLIENGLLELSEDKYKLSPAGQPLAEKYRTENPKHLYFYNEYYTRAQQSRAHGRFCELVYGKNLCQHGMMDMAQLDQLIDILALGENSRVLELGCGNGLVAEYISDTTQAQVTGVDMSTVGIRQAVERARDKRSRLEFMRADMREIDFPPATFDTAIAVDSVYFVGDLEELVRKLRKVVKPGGQMGVFFSAWVLDESKRDLLLADKTKFAEALKKHGLQYTVWDLTSQEIEHWRRKLQVVAGLRQDFEDEGNLFLYQNRFTEASCHNRHVDAGLVCRYLYHIIFPRGNGMIIEQAQVADAREILALQKLAYQGEAEIYQDYTIPPLTQTFEEIEREFKTQTFLKAIVDGQLIGSVRAYLQGETCYIGRLIVHPDFQNQGIGAKLMHEIEGRFAHARRYELFTGERSERNLYFYQKLGYRIVRKEGLTDKVTLVFLEKRTMPPDQQKAAQDKDWL